LILKGGGVNESGTFFYKGVIECVTKCDRWGREGQKN